MIHKHSGVPAVRAMIGTGVAVAVRTPLGLRPPQLWSGLRFGGAAAAAVAAGVAAAAVVPQVRAAMHDRELPVGALRWLALDIPLGTVWTEETIFRGLLQTLAARAIGPTGGRLLQAVAFGLWHIPDARKTGEPIVGTVVVTAAAGWVFGWLAERSGSVLAPALAHLAINEVGAVAALVAQR
ncbi:Abortive infection protein [uncultured Mycobacterium sp.]|uniref:Abortive infection protein n=1 Tax=uncultured Mycobacterium sp. TaxID=171292 RepID=A0A1Y5P0W0_9MYCO|nr:Abortive infection protein [uncultured Mycobacterium sp.]